MDPPSTRQKLAPANIAAADTRGYRSQDIDFQAEFQNLAGGAPRLAGVAGPPVKNDGTHVNIDGEARLPGGESAEVPDGCNLLRSQVRGGAPGNYGSSPGKAKDFTP